MSLIIYMEKYKSFYEALINDKEIEYKQYPELGFESENNDNDGLNLARYGTYQNLFKIQNISFKDFILCLMYGKVNELFENCFDENGTYVKGKLTLTCEYAKKLHDEMEYLIPIEAEGIPITTYKVPGNPINGFSEVEKNNSLNVVKEEYKSADDFIKNAMDTCIINEKQTNVPWKMALQLITLQKSNQFREKNNIKEANELVKKTREVIMRYK